MVNKKYTDNAVAKFMQAEAMWAMTVLGYLAKLVLGVLGYV